MTESESVDSSFSSFSQCYLIELNIDMNTGLVFALILSSTLTITNGLPTTVETTTETTPDTTPVSISTSSFSPNTTLSEDEIKNLPCDQLVDHMSLATNKMLIIFNPVQQLFASPNDFVGKYCTPFNGWFAVSKEYRRCLKAFPKSLYAMITNNIRKTYKNYCFDPVKIDFAYSHVKCFRSETYELISSVAMKLVAFFQVCFISFHFFKLNYNHFRNRMSQSWKTRMTWLRISAVEPDTSWSWHQIHWMRFVNLMLSMILVLLLQTSSMDVSLTQLTSCVESILTWKRVKNWNQKSRQT